MDRVKKMGSIAVALVLLPPPLLLISSANPNLRALDRIAILSGSVGLILAAITVIYWVVLYRAKTRA